MDFKKFFKTLLFPNIVIMILLIPISVAFLLCAMLLIGTSSIPAYISYALAAYTLTVWCTRIPNIMKFFKRFREENKYAKRWIEDARLRVRVTLYSSLIWNSAYALFQLWLGIYHSTFWFTSLGIYYLSLAVMRFFLARYTSRHLPGDDMRGELLRYRAVGWIFLFMNLALSLIVFFMTYWNRTFRHHEITTIMMAAYTFTAFTFAIINIVKYRKYNSPVYSASKAINLASAAVSMLTLESTMLTTFGKEMSLIHRRLFLGLSGGAISAFVIVMAISMIIVSSKKLKASGTSNQQEKI